MMTLLSKLLCGSFPSHQIAATCEAVGTLYLVYAKRNMLKIMYYKKKCVASKQQRNVMHSQVPSLVRSYISVEFNNIVI
jgi:hypothetical protein